MFNRIRNIRKRWFVVAASVALLAVGLVGGTVFAAGAPSQAIGNAMHHGYGHHDDQRSGKSNGGAVMARVAEILGVEQDTLKAAFATALDEQANVKFEERVQSLVDDETLTADQAAEANDWFDQRPESSGPLVIRLARTSDSDRVDSALEKLVEAQRLTQDEADALSEWHDDRPDSLPTTTRHRSGHRKGHRDGKGSEG